MIKKPLVNNQIKAPKVRVIDETGKQLGVISLEEALRLSRERNLDLIQVTEKVEPPVCKIGDYGKYLYYLEKKEKGVKRSSAVKRIRLSFNISFHDLENKVHQAEGFLKKGDKVMVEMPLKGREKTFEDFAKKKIGQFLEVLEKSVPIKIERELKKEPRGFTIIINRQ